MQSMLSRRSFLASSAIAMSWAAGAPRSCLGAANAAPAKSMIVLWMNGGPATIDLWDVKPYHENGGPTREIETSVCGTHISEFLPRLAREANDFSILRSMTSKEGDHGRASLFVHTGYAPQPAIRFPVFGSLVANERRDDPLDLPLFVSIAPRRFAGSSSGGFLGPRFAPLVIGEGSDSPANLKVPDLARPGEVSDVMQSDRLSLLQNLDRQFRTRSSGPILDSLQSATERAVRLMSPEAAATFEIEKESDTVRDAYGRNVFGQSCLLARRLVEKGVPFVEATLDGWDTHNNNFTRVQTLAGTLDVAFTALLRDLRERGLLESTMVLCIGEFGRTPKINGNTGRDHWPGTWSTVVAGGGIRGGQVIGATSDDGMQVRDRPVTVPDLIATASQRLGIDPTKQNVSNVGRPIRIADPVARVIEELV
jgi:hypothetical protein